MKFVSKVASEFPTVQLLILRHWSIFSSAHLSLDAGKTRLVELVRGRHTEQLTESQPGFTASFLITGGFLNAAISSLKRVPEKIFKFGKLFYKTKQKL